MSKRPVRRLGAVTIVADSDHDIKRLAGFSIRESAATAAAAEVNIRHADGAGTNTGDLVAVIELAADDDEQVNFGDAAYLTADNPNGFHVEVVAGTVEGVLYEAK